MRRSLHILAILVAVGVIVAAFVELDRRSDEDDLAIAPTVLPSPSRGPQATGEPDSTDEPEATGPEATEEVFTPPPVDTVGPPESPTPEPLVTPGPTDIENGLTPHTGASSAPAGIALALVALAGRTLVTRRRRSY